MFERFFAFILIIILSPLFGLITLLILILDGKPVFFSHKRYGLKFNRISIHKFRTMKSGTGSPITLHEDERITGLGKVLRLFKLDELPQLINIISGEMSFVGPRPESIQIVERNQQYFKYLDHIKPGITDINSILFKDEAKLFKITDFMMYEKEILPLKSEITVKYSSNNSVIGKGMILLLTLFSFIHHIMVLRILSRYFLPSVDREIRNKLNNLFLRKIF